MPNFCINFLNKAAKSLPILYDFTVASLMDAWIKIHLQECVDEGIIVASLMDAWIKIMPPCLLAKLYAVASLADAWIKMQERNVHNEKRGRSHPSSDAWIKI